MYVSALRRVVPLFFAFGRTNYCRWTPIHYEECLTLQEKYPLLYSAFSQGDFVVHHTVRRASGVPVDQALEQAYNKPAKGSGGMVGITKRKEAVAKWNIIKHQKAKYTRFIEDVTKVKDYSEYSLHQEFSAAKTKEVERNVKTLYQYLEDKDLLKDGNLINIASGEIIDDETKRLSRLHRKRRKTVC